MIIKRDYSVILEKTDYGDSRREITVIKNDDFSELTGKIISACFEVHKKLGPGLSEKIYVNSLKIVLDDKLIKYEEEKEFNVAFNEKFVGKFRVDLVANNKVIVEIKAVNGYMPKIFESQVISYLKSSGLKIGLLVNFGNRSCEVRRLVNP
ncbi:MAG: GxxExxY protein [Candidatus Omnitrophica bacterium]|nr:GxxExxY protein [Candidatus Omnitrophota bacterium]